MNKAFCSSSDFRAKLILEVIKTAFKVPSFKITEPSLISAISKLACVAGLPDFFFFFDMVRKAHPLYNIMG